MGLPSFQDEVESAGVDPRFPRGSVGPQDGRIAYGNRDRMTSARGRRALPAQAPPSVKLPPQSRFRAPREDASTCDFNAFGRHFPAEANTDVVGPKLYAGQAFGAYDDTVQLDPAPSRTHGVHLDGDVPARRLHGKARTSHG
jgi:hypothetical protein